MTTRVRSSYCLRLIECLYFEVVFLFDTRVQEVVRDEHCRLKQKVIFL